jgi:hypothetical protein
VAEAGRRLEIPSATSTPMGERDGAISAKAEHVAADVRGLADSGLTNLQKSFRMSDHYPLWVEFEVP